MTPSAMTPSATSALFDINDTRTVTIYEARGFANPAIEHAWLEWNGGAAGFYGNGYGPNSRNGDTGSSSNSGGMGYGTVVFPEQSTYVGRKEGPAPTTDITKTRQNRKFIREKIVIDPGKYNVDNFFDNLTKEIKADQKKKILYDPVFGNCLAWAQNVVTRAKKKSRCKKR